MDPAHRHDPLARAELTFLLGMGFQLLLTEFTDRLAAAGYADLRPVHGMAFQALRDGGATSSELAERLGVTKQAAGQIVDDLERRGYVRREPHPAGGRRRLVVLTGAAREHLEVAGRVLRHLEAEVAEEGAGADTEVLRRELARLIRALSGDRVPPLRPVW
ncbi:MarR family winged helix-turn-helix transcriptional regulator [Streptomonospora nanhaiensis]|uniref:DNA-binding MarR family transcriptional regulator n=1 Tax=Streptomonospora nanhaiensis TaxID=1323731 RepID=A0A853BQS5_9ACTN|nr:MarR family transcriptional regulator [Streptomonospora nanhaiensis]MBV2363946.1 MarR family transcriptional regulator [Streptomonospora nanhaiensis]MBX9388411.1 MarR family transcriptional regulator [Streptomonospora nanhaiensis]NYI96742.1 DNA-binding MarR family transcriptional regulator [Streptomonospora nanhaiensis]